MESRDVFASSKQLEDISKVYMEAVYGKSAGQELADREKKDDAFGAPKKKMVVTNADKKANTPAYQNYKKGDKRYVAADHMKEEEGIAKVVGYLDELKKSTLGSYVKKATTDLANRSFDHGESEKRQYEPDAEDEKEEKKQNLRKKGIDRAADKLAKEEFISEKQKDTPDQVKAVIAYDKARKGTDDAVYDSEHGKKKQAKKERDYAKWQRDKGAEDAQKSGHPWEHAKGSTREKEGKKSEKHAHIKDNYEPLHSTAIAGYANAYQAVYENWSGNEQNELVTKEVKALQKAAKTGKGKDVAKLVGSGKFTKEEIWDIYEADTYAKQLARFEAGRRKRMKASGTYERPNWIPKDQDHSDDYGSSKGKKTTKEGYQRNPEKGEAEERKAERDRKASGRMPPRGNKDREEFERWYAANVR